MNHDIVLQVEILKSIRMLLFNITLFGIKKVNENMKEAISEGNL